MPTPIFTAVLLFLLPGDPPARSETPRQASPFAPSLPLLTEAEEKRLDDTINRFILADIGRLKGSDAQQALADFKRLGPEASFALIRGINRAAQIEGSCPALVIGKKLESILRSTRDADLLEFARENIGAGVTQSRHLGYLHSLRAKCIVWKRSAADRAVTLRAAPDPERYQTIKPLARMTTAELAEAARREKGARLQAILKELARRDGDEAYNALADAAAAEGKELRVLGGQSLDAFMARQSPAFIKKRLKDDWAAVRALAARLCGDKGIRCFAELIDLVIDTNGDVRQAARGALVKLSGGADFGPKPDESIGGQDEAQRKWRAWLSKQGGR